MQLSFDAFSFRLSYSIYMFCACAQLLLTYFLLASSRFSSCSLLYGHPNTCTSFEHMVFSARQTRTRAQRPLYSRSFSQSSKKQKKLFPFFVKRISILNYYCCQPRFLLLLLLYKYPRASRMSMNTVHPQSIYLMYNQLCKQHARKKVSNANF